MRLLKLVLAGVLSANSFYAFADEGHPVIPIGCVTEFTSGSENSDQLSENPAITLARLKYTTALSDLTTYLPHLFPDIHKQDYYQVLTRLLSASQVDDGNMVLTAIIGPAGMGKSTLSNAIWALANNSSDYKPEHLVSAPGRRSGLTIRPLIFAAKGDSVMKRKALNGLRARYGDLEIYQHPDDPTRKGPPLLAELEHLNDFPNQLFVDTPDMTTGDPQLNSAPVHRQTARDALLPAEVLLIMLNDENVRDFPLREMLMENFKKYGVRKSIFVLKTDAETDEEFAESREWLLETIRSIYGFKPNQRRELEEAVLGMYAMQKKRAVRLGLEHPKLIPFDGSEHFATLINDMATNATEIRSYAGKKAAELLVEKVGGQVDEMDMQNRLKQIYAKALEGMLEIPPSNVSFPYDQARDQWRELFTAQTPKSTRYLDKTANLASKVRKMVPKMSLAEEPLEKVLTTFDTSLKVAWLGRLSSILHELAHDQVRVPEAHGKELLMLVKEFNKRYPAHDLEQTVTIDSETKDMTITLPARTLLPKEDLSKVEVAIKQKSEALLKTMAETPDNQTVHLVNVDEVVKGLRSVLTTNYEEKAKRRDVVADVVTVGGPLTAIAKVGFFVTASTLTGGAAALALLGTAATSGVGAAYLRRWREGKTDVDLKPKLDEWFKVNQATEFKERLNKFFLQSVRTQLAVGLSGTENTALDKVRDALETLLAKKAEDDSSPDPSGNLGIRSITKARINARGAQD